MPPSSLDALRCQPPGCNLAVSVLCWCRRRHCISCTNIERTHGKWRTNSTKSAEIVGPIDPMSHGQGKPLRDGCDLTQSGLVASSPPDHSSKGPEGLWVSVCDVKASPSTFGSKGPLSDSKSFFAARTWAIAVFPT